MGISPDVIITRSDSDCGEAIRKKIALFCNVKEDCVIANTTADCLYEVPIMLHNNGLDKVVCRELGLKNKCDLSPWKAMVKDIHSRKGTVHIAIVGKYTSLHDSYLSIVESLNHASYACHTNVQLHWIDSEGINRQNVAEKLAGVQGVLIPGGFGTRGTEGMIEACRYARENGVPYFGICLGMQIAVIEFARNVAGIKDATSGEFSKSGSHVIDLMPDQNGKRMGGTMRLGAYPCVIKEGTNMAKAYGKQLIEERHRHRYEFNNSFRAKLEEAGLIISGTSPDGNIVETVEAPSKGFFIGVQFHPEFTSRPNRANPIFRDFVAAAKEYKK